MIFNKRFFLDKLIAIMSCKYYYRYFFLLVASLFFVPSIFSLETICKFELCGNTITGTKQLNLPIGETEIWVYIFTPQLSITKCKSCG